MKMVATFLTLVATTIVTAQWGQVVDPIQISMYVIGMVLASTPLVSYLRCADRGTPQQVLR